MNSPNDENLVKNFIKNRDEKAEKFGKHINSKSRIFDGGRIIIAHIALENSVEEYIYELNELRFKLKPLKLSFFVKLEMAKASYQGLSTEIDKFAEKVGSVKAVSKNLKKEDLPIFFDVMRILNVIRNDYAHRLDIDDIRKKHINFLQSFLKEHRKDLAEIDSYPLSQLYVEAAAMCAGFLHGLTSTIGNNGFLYVAMREIKKILD